MARNALERDSNPHGHCYYFDTLSRTHICNVCGTCERRNGVFWWAGKWSRAEPPCDYNATGQRQWHNNANPDPDLDKI
ncbi:hypothetical protein NMD31_26990 (plasmid) [Escherichia coli]|uniref:hypothetical protein n=1 Tax=Escherichia coli TaxID=562 RepID=UPI00351CFBE2